MIWNKRLTPCPLESIDTARISEQHKHRHENIRSEKQEASLAAIEDKGGFGERDVAGVEVLGRA
jgi:hypothetical protein